MISVCNFGRYYKVKCDWLIRADVTKINFLLGFADVIFGRDKQQAKIHLHWQAVGPLVSQPFVFKPQFIQSQMQCKHLA